MSRDIQKLRNIGVIAHIDAGKTTVTERMLYYSGAKHRVGRVDAGTTETDSDAEEQERGITIYSACVTFPWKDVIVNLLDTPGHVDFTAEVERCLRVLDGAVVVFSAREGVEAQSETVWRQADKYNVPRIAFINKMDREGADFEAVFEQVGSRLGANPVALQIPVGQGPAHVSDPFRGVVDLISMTMLSFDPESEGREITRQDPPDDVRETAAIWREAMLEKLYDYSNELMELALQEKEIPAELIYRVLRDATIHQQLQPVLCGSALHGIGVQPVLDAVQAFLPSPADRPAVAGTLPDKPDSSQSRKPALDEPFCGLVFKILAEKTGDLYWVRVYSGRLKANSRAYNPAKDKKENIAQLWHIHATRKEPKGQVDEATTGDIVAVIGPRQSVTGDTLCDAKHPLVLPTIEFAETVISMAIEPESAAERKKLAEVLEMLKRQDPTFRAVENEETGQTIISGMGELHLEVIKHRLLRDFNLNVKVHKPRVSYRETVEQKVEATGECHRVISGKQLFARLTIRMEHAPQLKQPVAILNLCPPEKLSGSLLAVVLEELVSCGEGGGHIAGFPLMNVKVTVLDAEVRDEGSDDVAFRIAASDAFRSAIDRSGPQLLEPLMKVEINTPEDYMGELVNDLQQRRAIIVKNETRGDRATLVAHAPMEELFGYSGAVRSLSQGRANHSMEPLKYAVAPPEIRKKYEM